jgi:hypothetical protein
VIQDVHPESHLQNCFISWIPDPDPGIKKHWISDPRSQIPDLDLQYCLVEFGLVTFALKGIVKCDAYLRERSINALISPCRSSFMPARSSSLGLRLLRRPLGFSLNKCVCYMHINFS